MGAEVVHGLLGLQPRVQPRQVVVEERNLPLESSLFANDLLSMEHLFDAVELLNHHPDPLRILDGGF